MQSISAVKKLTAMVWAGGKSHASSTGTGVWVSSLLPSGRLYVEPFAGMLGVLLQRPPSHQEIVNDLDERVVNWWRVVRDNPEELARLIAYTPKSRIEYERALLDAEKDPIRRALDFTIVTLNSLGGKHVRSAFRATYSSSVGVEDWRRGIDSRISQIADRIKHVQLEHRDAVSLLERLAKESHAVVYCDPPYSEVSEKIYSHSIDKDSLTSVLLAQQGRIAISGYGQEWDHLQWERHEHTTVGRLSTNGPSLRTRTEVLWTNYPAATRPRLL